MLTIARPQVEIDNEVQHLLQVEPENCTIIHCTYISTDEPLVAVRIWPSTFLVQDDGRRKKLIKPLNISSMPEWTYHLNSEVRFTLVFEGLDKSCTSFQLQEDIPEPGGFYSGTISRNSTDVYRVEVMC